MYGLLNIHKEGAPVRSIFNTIGGLTYLLTKFLSTKLKPLVGWTDDFESKALALALFQPKLWKMFVDDTYIIWSHGWEKLELFCQHLNNQFSYFKFTMECEIDSR